MSSRQIRRLMAEREKQKRKNEPKEDDPPEDFQPHFFDTCTFYEGLELPGCDPPSEHDSSLSENQPSCDRDQDDDGPTVIPEEDKYGAKKKIPTNTNTKKKNKHKKKTKKPDEMDEVEWSVKEVNRILGSPPQVKETSVVDEKYLLKKSIFSINSNYINVNYELDKVFGPDPERIRRPRKSLRSMRHEIGLSLDIQPFRVKGLSMSLHAMNGDVKYFKYVHSSEYQLRCRALNGKLRLAAYSAVQRENGLLPEDCVESLLENSDFFYYLEKHKAANNALEQVINCMQLVGEPTFNFVDGKTRLPYDYVENRPFHIALLKYIHVLTNIANHRTALELAKVLFNLDPMDPLAVIFILDTLAIRAQQFQWLIDLIDFWKEKRQPHRLFHMRYSMSLALFHLACKKKDQNAMDEAKNILTQVIKDFPLVAVKIIEISKMRCPDEIKNHEMFKPSPNITHSRCLDELMILYARLIAAMWLEPKVKTWFMDTVTELTEAYNSDHNIKREMKDHEKVCSQLYRRIPVQMKRHLHAIAPMQSYICEGLMPHVEPTISFNPYPSEGTCIDTYNYFANWNMKQTMTNDYLLSVIREVNPDL